MLALCRPKRQRSRSPSVEHDMTSPLVGLPKRRRRNSSARPFSYSQPSYTRKDSTHKAHPSEPVEWGRFIEQRRTRQWEKLNAPQQSSSSSSIISNSAPYHQENVLGYHACLSQPGPFYRSDPHSPLAGPRWCSQPEPQRAPMSSSPIRHLPPSSSPFRAGTSKREENGSSDSQRTRFDEIDPEEMRREWGEEYAAQNSLLHNLHMARIHFQAETPDQTLLQTPSTASAHNQPFFTNGYTSYRTTYLPSSSPFTSQTINETPLPPTPDHHCMRHEDEGIGSDLEENGGRTEAEKEVKRRYEEANSLLAELEVVRRTRFGDIT